MFKKEEKALEFCFWLRPNATSTSSAQLSSAHRHNDVACVFHSHYGSDHSQPLELEQFAFGHGAEFDLGANGQWVIVVVDFPEELGNSVRPLADYFIVSINPGDAPRGKGEEGEVRAQDEICTYLAIPQSSHLPSIADRCC